MNFLRNTIGIFIGLAVAALIIAIGIRLNSSWVIYTEFAPFKHWKALLISLHNKPYFFVALLISSGIASIVGGVITAAIVKYAKVAYAILIGFILLFIAILDIIIFPYHPTFYKIMIFFIFFPFSWIGGKITEVIYERKRKLQEKSTKR